MIDHLKCRPAYTKIASRMIGVGIDIEHFMVLDESSSPLHSRKVGTLQRVGLEVGDNTLSGIKFKIRTPRRGRTLEETVQAVTSKNTMLMRLRSATHAGLQVFREGKVQGRPHWAIDLSMAATVGIGFREITYLDQFDRTRDLIPSGAGGRIQLGSNAVFSSQFGETRSRMDITALHVAVHGDLCSIHIDHTGFTIGPIAGLNSDDVALSPDFLHHAFVELLQREILHIPIGMEFYLPNTRNDFSRYGVRTQADLTPKIQLSIDVSKDFRNPLTESGDLNLKLFDNDTISLKGGMTMSVSLTGTF